jgi:SnoaL-like polyketide cyclase
LGSIGATGRAVAWMGISVFRLVEGKILEEIGEEDALSLLEQLGTVSKQSLR